MPKSVSRIRAAECGPPKDGNLGYGIKGRLVLVIRILLWLFIGRWWLHPSQMVVLNPVVVVVVVGSVVVVVEVVVVVVVVFDVVVVVVVVLGFVVVVSFGFSSTVVPSGSIPPTRTPLS